MTDKEFASCLFSLTVMSNCYFNNRPYEIDISNRPMETSVILNGRRVYSDTNTMADVATNYKRNVIIANRFVYMRLRLKSLLDTLDCFRLFVFAD